MRAVAVGAERLVRDDPRVFPSAEIFSSGRGGCPKGGSSPPPAFRAVLAFLAGVTLAGSGRSQELLWEKPGAPGSYFGHHLARLGDVNGDGVSDLGVGAMLAGPPFDAGKAFILSGVDGATLLQVSSPIQQGFLGFQVAGPGDVTQDGVADLLVSAITLGVARLYSGADSSIVYTADTYGTSAVGRAGDLNADGIPDYLVGAPDVGSTINLEGMVFVFSGADGSLLYNIPGTVPFSGFGIALGAVGDLSGDGVEDLLIGAETNGSYSFASGHAYVHAGTNGGFLGELPGPQDGLDRFGHAVAGLGDVTGDGVPDLAVGAPGAFASTTGGGQVRVFSGADFSLLLTINGTAYTDTVGASVDGPGDVDGDGVPDLLLGLPGSPPVVPPLGIAGKALLYSGATWTLLYTYPPPAGEALSLGHAVVGAGDLNGDGFLDLAVGAPGNPGLAPQYGPPPCKVKAYSGAPVGIAAYGAGCPGSTLPTPRIGATGSPRVGTTFTVNLSETQPAKPALLLLGLSSAAWWGIPLPLGLDFLGMPACSLLVSPDFPVGLSTTAFGPGRGRAVAPVQVPSQASLIGVSFYAQWYVVDPGPAAVPGAMTRALAITVQP
jgi:FG-GAP repeat protein